MSPKKPSEPKTGRRRRQEPKPETLPSIEGREQEVVDVDNADALRLLTFIAEVGSLPQYPRQFFSAWNDPSMFQARGTLWSVGAIQNTIQQVEGDMRFPRAKRPQARKRAAETLQPVLDHLRELVHGPATSTTEATPPTAKGAEAPQAEEQQSVPGEVEGDGIAFAFGTSTELRTYPGSPPTDLPIEPPTQTQTSKQYAETIVGGDRIARARKAMEAMGEEVEETWAERGVDAMRGIGWESVQGLQAFGMARRMDLSRFGDERVPTELALLKPNETLDLEYLKRHGLLTKQITKPNRPMVAERMGEGRPRIFLVGTYIEIPSESEGQDPLRTYHRFTDEELARIGVATREEPVFLGKQQPDDTHIQILEDEYFTQGEEGNGRLSREHVALFTGSDSAIRVVDVSANGGVHVVVQDEQRRQLEDLQSRMYRAQKEAAAKQGAAQLGPQEDEQ